MHKQRFFYVTHKQRYGGFHMMHSTDRFFTWYIRKDTSFKCVFTHELALHASLAYFPVFINTMKLHTLWLMSQWHLEWRSAEQCPPLHTLVVFINTMKLWVNHTCNGISTEQCPLYHPMHTCHGTHVASLVQREKSLQICHIIHKWV